MGIKSKRPSDTVLILLGISIGLSCMYGLLVVLRKYVTEEGTNIAPPVELCLLIISTILTFLAFYVQFLYNRRQKEDLNIERFENIFFKYIDNQRAIVEACQVYGITGGKQTFHFMFYEYKAIYYKIWKQLSDKNTKNLEKAIFESFKIFLNGVSPSATARIEEESDDDVKIALRHLNGEFLKEQHSIANQGMMPKYLRDYDGTDIKLYDGHRLRIIPFVRHMCMFVQYIYSKTGDNKALFDFYIRAMLAQMSEHELALAYLCYNMGSKEYSDFLVGQDKTTDDFFNHELPQYITSPTLLYDHPKFVG